MQIDDLESQVSTSATLLAYPRLTPRLTMPIRKNGNMSEIASRDGLPTEPLSASQLLENQATTYPFQSQSISPIRPTYSNNGHSDLVLNTDELLTSPLPLSPILKNVPSDGWEMSAIAGEIWDQPTTPLRIVTSPVQRRSTLRELPHLAGYIVGAATILTLYLIIPFLILLNATVPSNWNKLLIALGILALGECIICLILIKTTPRHKAKKEKVLVQL
jgi:hypothetical protein